MAILTSTQIRHKTCVCVNTYNIAGSGNGGGHHGGGHMNPCHRITDPAANATCQACVVQAQPGVASCKQTTVTKYNLVADANGLWWLWHDE